MVAPGAAGGFRGAAGDLGVDIGEAEVADGGNELAAGLGCIGKGRCLSDVCPTGVRTCSLARGSDNPGAKVASSFADAASVAEGASAEVGGLVVSEGGPSGAVGGGGALAATVPVEEAGTAMRIASASTPSTIAPRTAQLQRLDFEGRGVDGTSVAPSWEVLA